MREIQEKITLTRNNASKAMQIMILHVVFNARPGRGGGCHPPPPEGFLRCARNYEADRAEILHSLWGILCATVVKKIDQVMSGNGAMTSQEVQGQVIFARNSGIWLIRRRYRGFF